jgi:hypothetical protein
MCTVEIRTVVGVDTDGDNERDEIIVVGIVEDCSGLQVGLFNILPPAGAQISDSAASRAASILAPGVSAHGVVPTGNERVFTVTFTLADETVFKGACGTAAAGGNGMGLLAVCDDDEQCRDAVFWDQPIDCVDRGGDCPVVSIAADVSDQCQGETRSVGLSLVANPFSAGLAADVDYGDGSAPESVTFSSLDIGGGIVIGQAAASHGYSVPGTGTTTFQVAVTIEGRSDCVTTVDVDVPECPAESTECPVERVTLVVVDSAGTDVTPQIQAGLCLTPGRYVVRADIEPPGATTAFLWRVDGLAAVAGQLDVTAITGDELTIELATSFRSVSVIAAGCASDGVDLRPCEEPCCPDLTGLSASCMPRCDGRSTEATLTADGTDLECAEVFAWEFGDGTSTETGLPATTHTYPSFGRFEAAVTIVRSEECGAPRTQRRTAVVEPCPLPCYCVFLAIASAFLLLAFLTLMPLIACATDPGVRQTLIIIMIAVVVLMAILMLWWFLDECCRPTRCELLKILFWVFSWALVILGIIAIFCVMEAMNIGAIAIVLPFAFLYVIAQQIFLRMINEGGCGQPPDIFSWPFPACR